jgi:hypothetical protein
MNPRLCAVLLGLPLCIFAAADSAGVAQTVAKVREALHRKQSDAQIAKWLGKIAPAERLDWHVIEELESEGAGPRTVAALERLREFSENLTPPSPSTRLFDSPPEPTRIEMNRAISGARDYALNYGRNLPDFLCNESVRRMEDFSGPRGLAPEWRAKDLLLIKLSYAGHTEEYKPVSINGRPTNRSMEGLGGAISEGEFGSMLVLIFDKGASAAFSFDHWTHLRKRALQVYSYDIDARHSKYRIRYGANGVNSAADVGAHGWIYIDPGTHEIMRLTRDATEIPDGFPVNQAKTIIDYDFADIGGRQYLLPMRAVVWLGTEWIHTRNEVEFSGYRKFTGESTITFGDEPVKH